MKHSKFRFLFKFCKIKIVTSVLNNLLFLKFYLFFCLIALYATSCTPKYWTVTNAVSSKIAIDNSTDSIADKAYTEFLMPYKKSVDDKMNVVIGTVAENMKAHAPESLLSNFSADVYREAATNYFGEKVDIAIVNLGGLRTEIPKGDLKVRKIFELMPFENTLNIIWLKGDKLLALLEYFATMGGEGVSGLRMTIDNKKATDITINGELLDINKVYTIATNDYLANGNDKMVQLAMHDKKNDTGIKIRDMLMQYVKNETLNGRIIQASLDGRIQVKQKK